MGKIKKIYCDNYSLIYSNRICCFNNRFIKLQYEFDENNVLTVTFNFYYDNEHSNTRYNMTSPEPANVTFDLYNFNNSLGTGLVEPICIAKYHEKSIFVVFFVYKIEKANPIIDVSLYLED